MMDDCEQVVEFNETSFFLKREKSFQRRFLTYELKIGSLAFGDK